MTAITAKSAKTLKERHKVDIFGTKCTEMQILSVAICTLSLYPQTSIKGMILPKSPEKSKEPNLDIYRLP